jgi:hypothetical protein
MTTTSKRFEYICDRIREAQESGETDTPLGRVLAKWQGIDIPVGTEDGQWLLDGFIMTFKREREILAAIDPSVSPDLPPHLLDPVQIAYFMGIRLEDFKGFSSPGIEAEYKQIDTHEEFGEPPQEVGTAEAADILGVSKDTVLKLKAAGLLEYRNMAPPGSSRPIYAFTLRSVMALRTGYERETPTPSMPSEPQRRRAAPQSKKYKHVKLED